ncbi:MAG: restriction endonuclease [Planctomycetota bacterium]|nr:restriction endonuclease [Planctomycetota bacterium]
MAKLPKYTDFFSPVLLVLRPHPEGIRRPQIKELVAGKTGLTKEQLNAPMPSGRGLIFGNRVGWALSYLKYAGLAETLTRGVWRLTSEGARLADANPNGLSADKIKHIDELARARSRAQNEKEGDDGTSSAANDTDGTAPDELIERAVKQIEAGVVADLLTEIVKVSDQRFELLVLDVLNAMGYAWDDQGIQHTGRSGDGGIDGVIDMDPLGIQKVYVQAKKWTGNVGRKELQAFVGSLAGFQARVGVFITASEFTREASEYGSKLPDRIVLVDGKKLARLMIQHSVGVTPKMIRVPQLDSDYFEEG